MIQVNIEMLVHLKVTPDEYIFLKLIMDKRYQYLQDIYSLLTIREDELIKRGYLKRIKQDNEKTYVFERFLLRKKFELDFIGDKDVMWAELVSLYPYKVPSPKSSDMRILHAADPNSHTNSKLKEKYLKAIDSDNLMHKKVIKALKAELQVKKNSLGYLQNFATWLNQHSWENYLDIVEKGTLQEPEDTGADYGQELK